IFSSNLDEFFMKRIQLAKRREQAAAGAGVTVLEIRERLDPMLRQQAEVFAGLVGELKRHGISLAAWDELTEEQRAESRAYFRSDVLAILTPLAYDPAHPFPFLSNLSTSLGVILLDPDTAQRCFARIKVPNVLPWWVALRARGADQAVTFVRLHD